MLNLFYFILVMENFPFSSGKSVWKSQGILKFIFCGNIFCAVIKNLRKFLKRFCREKIFTLESKK